MRLPIANAKNNRFCFFKFSRQTREQAFVFALLGEFLGTSFSNPKSLSLATLELSYFFFRKGSDDGDAAVW